MRKMPIEMANEPIIGNAGLLAVAELIRISELDAVCLHRESPNTIVPEKDVLRCLADLSRLAK